MTNREQIIAAAQESVSPYTTCWLQYEIDFLERFYAIAFEDGASRYKELRRGQHWSVIDGIGNILRGDDLDVAVDRAIRARGDTK